MGSNHGQNNIHLQLHILHKGALLAGALPGKVFALRTEVRFTLFLPFFAEPTAKHWSAT